MGTAFLYGNGGGSGGSLNFSVKTYTTEEALLAAAPRENTVGVVTNTAVPKWGFSASEPSAPEEGEIWFSLGTESDAAFNALKKNILSVYPKRCRQYLSGAWTNVSAYIYKSGVWVQFSKEWDGTLYANGNQYTAITGGWVGGHCDDRYQTGTQTLTYNSDGTVSWKNVNNGTWGMITANTIDLSEYKYLYVHGSGKLSVNVAETFPMPNGVSLAYNKQDGTDLTRKVLIDSINSGKIAVYNYGNGTVTVKSILLSNEDL